MCEKLEPIFNLNGIDFELAPELAQKEQVKKAKPVLFSDVQTETFIQHEESKQEYLEDDA